MSGLLDLIAAKTPEQAGGLLSAMTVGPRQRLSGLLNDPAGFMGQALREGLGLDDIDRRWAWKQNKLDAVTGSDYTRASVDEAANRTAMNLGLAGLTVWHGSPHKFNKFDMSKIGTGEGAQAYGHGLYMAESPKVASSYMNMGPREWWLNGEKFDPSSLKGIDKQAWNIFLSTPPNVNPMEHAATLLSEGKISLNKYSAVGKFSRAELRDPTGGNMYKVDIPDDLPSKMLDWDKPLSQQPQNVKDFFSANGFDLGNAMSPDELYLAAKKYLGSRQAVKMANADIYFARDLSAARKAWNGGADSLDAYMNTGDGSWLRGVLTGAKDGNMSGGAAYRMLSDRLGGFGQAAYQGGGQIAASDALRTGGASLLGISDGLRRFPSGGSSATISHLVPGIKYFDGGSRGAGQGTYNYVLFDDQIPRILEINGKPTGLLPYSAK